MGGRERERGERRARGEGTEKRSTSLKKNEGRKGEKEGRERKEEK